MKTLKSLFKSHKAVEYKPLPLEYYVERAVSSDDFYKYVFLFTAAALLFTWSVSIKPHY